MKTKSRVRTIATTSVFAIFVLFANAEAARAQSTHYASVTNDASNKVYEIMRISRDSANWSQSGYEITVRNSYYNGGGIVKAFVGYGYQDSGTITILEAAGQNQPKIFLGSEVVVSGTIRYVPVNIQVPAWQYFSVEVKFGTTETTSITGASQVQFTGESSTTGATGANHDGSVTFTGNVGIGATSPGSLLTLGAGIPTLELKSTNWGSSTYIQNNVTAAGGGSGNFMGFYNPASKGFSFIQDGTAALVVDTTGSVGIGTTSPISRLHLKDGTNRNLRFVSDSGAYGTAGILLQSLTDASSNAPFVIAGDPIALMSGNVGIGTTTPGQKLDILGGNINVSSSGGVGGNITISGTINAKYQDVAEWVPSSEQLSAGTVVVLDSTKSNQVISASESYDTRVAGVISEQPGLALGEKGKGKVLVATTGRVKVKVDASKSPIRIGDLLVTSDLPGVAMKSEPVELGGRKMHMPGTLIGKALEPLEKGSGTILVLLSLQ